VTVDAKGRVTAGSTLVAGDIPSLPASVIGSGVLGVANGGTGAATITNNGVVIGAGAGALSSATGTIGQVMTVNGSNQPIFGTVNLGAAAAVSGTLAVANGGTGVTTGTANLMFATPSGSSGAPSLRALTATDLPFHSAALINSGTLGVANGGTGLTAAPANGQIAIGNGTNYALATLTAGSGISITNGSGSVNIASTVTPSNYVAVAGSTMTGVLNLPANGLVAGTNQLVLSGGNVGIGTTSPTKQIQVYSPSNQTMIQVTSSYGTANDVGFRTEANSTYWDFQINRLAAGATNASIGNLTAGNVMTFTTAGNVGIAANNPSGAMPHGNIITYFLGDFFSRRSMCSPTISFK